MMMFVYCQSCSGVNERKYFHMNPTHSEKIIFIRGSNMHDNTTAATKLVRTQFVPMSSANVQFDTRSADYLLLNVSCAKPAFPACLLDYCCVNLPLHACLLCAAYITVGNL